MSSNTLFVVLREDTNGDVFVVGIRAYEDDAETLINAEKETEPYGRYWIDESYDNDVVQT